MERYRVEHAMSKHVVVIPVRPRVRDIVELLRTTIYAGYPVVAYSANEREAPKFVGMILRSQLHTLLAHEAWENEDGYSREVTEDTFRRCVRSKLDTRLAAAWFSCSCLSFVRRRARAPECYCVVSN
jgi:predicted transcriptional regulator